MPYVHLSVEVADSVDVLAQVERRVIDAIESALQAVPPPVGVCGAWVTVDGALQIQKQDLNGPGDRLLLCPREPIYDNDTRVAINTTGWLTWLGQSSVVLLVGPVLLTLPRYYLIHEPRGLLGVQLAYAVILSLCFAISLTRLNVSVFKRLLRCFEFWYLVGNLLLALGTFIIHTLHVIHTNTGLILAIVLLGLFTSVPMTVLICFGSDAMEVPRWLKLCWVILGTVWCFQQVIQARLGTSMQEDIFIDFTVRRVPTRVLYSSALGNIVVFTLKFVYNILVMKRDVILLRSDLIRTYTARCIAPRVPVSSVHGDQETVCVHIQLSSSEEGDHCDRTLHDALQWEGQGIVPTSSQAMVKCEPGDVTG